MICGCSPERPHRGKPLEMSALSVHEILRGPLRGKTLGSLSSLLVTCWLCNSLEMTNRTKWPEARQLAVLLKRLPDHYDLIEHNRLANERAPDRILQSEVDEWLMTIPALA
jgi:hypothetical protein